MFPADLRVLGPCLRPKPLLGLAALETDVLPGRQVPPHAQVYRLILRMVRTRERDARQKIRRQRWLERRVFNRFALASAFRVCRVTFALLIPKRPGGASAEKERVDARVHDSSPESKSSVERWANIAHLVEVVVYPALFERLFVRGQVDRAVVLRLEGIVSGLRGEHCGLHGIVGALNLGNVEEARGAANERTAREVEFGNRLETALVEHARAVCYPRGVA